MYAKCSQVINIYFEIIEYHNVATNSTTTSTTRGTTTSLLKSYHNSQHQSHSRLHLFRVYHNTLYSSEAENIQVKVHSCCQSVFQIVTGNRLAPRCACVNTIDVVELPVTETQQSVYSKWRK